VGKRVRALDIAGVMAQAYWKRTYPENTLAAHLLGFVNEDRTGYYGLEGQYDGLLNGTTLKSDIPDVRPGADLVLTLDRTAQAIAEEELARGMQERARVGSIIDESAQWDLAMAARRCSIKSICRLAKTDINQFVNPVTANFEPGST
jgi:cell division protein FtsI/penicillin-binding protein 2